MSTQNFDGGATPDASVASTTADSGVYVEDAVAWNKGNLDLNGQYRVKINSIEPYSASGWSYYRIRVGGNDYASGAIVSNKNTTSATVRLYKTGSGTGTFWRDLSGGPIDSVIRQYTISSGTNSYTWSSASMAGKYTYTTVATAPAIGTPTVNKQAVTVTYTDSTSDGGATITAYNMQYSSDDGVTWSTAEVVTGNTHTFNLLPNTTYKFRVYATNGVGDGAASVSTAVTTPPAMRGRVYDTVTNPSVPAWRNLTIGKRYDGSAWVELTTFRRYDGTSWIDIT